MDRHQGKQKIGKKSKRATAMILLLAVFAGGCAYVSGDEEPTQVRMTETEMTSVPETTQESEQVTEPETTAPPQTEATEEPENTQVLKILSYPETVSPRQEAVVAIQGKPYTEYRITVRYKSGPSQAAGLEPKITDAEGNVSWTWRIGSRTSQGTYPIEIAGCGEKETVHFTVTG